jgi:hypothetical protein
MISNERSRAQVLAELARRLPAAMLGEALEAARAISDRDSHAWVLEELAKRVIDETWS